MDASKMAVITGIIILSLATGYLKGRRKFAALVALGIMLSVYLSMSMAE